jgi:GH24 family phage-related lysozyme (muramidase)
MSRSGISTTYVSSSVSLIQPYLAAYMDFSGSAVRLWTGTHNQAFNDDFGNGTYNGVGTLGTISTVTEATEVAAKGMDLTLSGIPTEYVSLALSNNYRGREVAVYLILYNTGMTAYEQVTLFRGRMDQMTIQEAKDLSSIVIKCENRLIDLNRQKDIRYTDEAQQIISPGDKGLEFVSSMADKSIYWGTSAPGSSANTGGGENGEGGDGTNIGGS